MLMSKYQVELILDIVESSDKKVIIRFLEHRFNLKNKLLNF